MSEDESIMEKFQIELEKVAKVLDPNRIPVRGNEHRLIRFAFDLFRVEGDETDDLWQLQADDDGNEFLVRTYSLPDEKVSEASDWSVLADKKYANLTVSFKGVPLTRLASKDYGAKNSMDGKSLQGLIFRKLSSDGAFVLNLLADLPKEKKLALKQAGLIEDIKNWLQSKDITEPIIEQITKLVEESVPGYEEEEPKEELEDQDSKDKFRPQVPVGNLGADDQWSLALLDLHLTKSAHCGECGEEADDSESPYQNMFDELLESFLAKHNVTSLDELPEEARQEMFEEADSRWDAENEADSRLASLGNPRVADVQPTPDFYAPGGESSGVDVVQNADVHEKFDVTDVNSGQGEWEPEEIELTEEDIEEVPDEKFVNPEEVKRILNEIKTLAPNDEEALKNFLKS